MNGRDLNRTRHNSNLTRRRRRRRRKMSVDELGFRVNGLGGGALNGRGLNRTRHNSNLTRRRRRRRRKRSMQWRRRWRRFYDLDLGV